MNFTIKKTFVIFFLSCIRCAADNYFIRASSSNNNDRLFFSFDKNFDNFKSNITEDILNHKSLSKPPFGFCEPLGNFLTTFCLFYRNSQIKHNKEFRVIFKNLFESCQDKEIKSSYAEISFNKYLELENDRIKNILGEKDISKQLVKVEEKNGRIICKLNDEFKIPRKQLYIYERVTLEDQLKHAIYEFYEKFNEMFCEGRLGTDYLSYRVILNEEYLYKEAIVPSADDDDDPFSVLFYFYYTVDNLLRDKHKFVFESEEFCVNFCKEQLKKAFKKSTVSIVTRYLKDDMPKYFNFLLSQTTAKIFNNISENSKAYSFYPFTYSGSVIAMKNNLEKFFEGKKLSDKSLLFLAIQCLEFDI